MARLAQDRREAFHDDKRDDIGLSPDDSPVALSSLSSRSECTEYEPGPRPAPRVVGAKTR